MPDFSLPKTCIKPYQNSPRGLMNALFLPTLKPEEPKDFIHGHAGYASKDVFSCESDNVHTPAANRCNLISYVHPRPSGSLVTGRHSIDSMNAALA
jgi:hypothetical protein